MTYIVIGFSDTVKSKKIESSANDQDHKFIRLVQIAFTLVMFV